MAFHFGGSDTEIDSQDRSRSRFWVTIVPVIGLLIAAFVICEAPERRDVPPPLQTFVKSSKKAALPIVRKTASEPLIRVNVTPGGTESLQLEIRGQYDLSSLDKDEKLSADSVAGKFTVSATKAGLKLGARQFLSSRIEIRPEQSPAIRINGHLYRGRIRLFRRTDGQVSAVNVLPVEEYLASVVDSEMPASFPDEARKAQAIIARTYALYQAEHADPNSMFDLLSSQRSQKYLGVEYVDATGRRLAGESESSRNVVRATRGIVCQRRHRLFCTYYSAVCGGQTTHGNEIFKDVSDAVQSVPCDWCRDSPLYRWTTELPREDFQKRANQQSANETLKLGSIRQLSEPGSGLISRFEFNDGKRQQTISGVELRERLPASTLLSPHFRIKLEKDRVVFEGRGHGHGVGFCQWGAKGQAEAGRKSLDIVRHYYPGTEVVTLDY